MTGKGLEARKLNSLWPKKHRIVSNSYPHRNVCGRHKALQSSVANEIRLKDKPKSSTLLRFDTSERWHSPSDTISLRFFHAFGKKEGFRTVPRRIWVTGVVGSGTRSFRKHSEKAPAEGGAVKYKQIDCTPPRWNGRVLIQKVNEKFKSTDQGRREKKRVARGHLSEKGSSGGYSE
ncbi:hypothetical protein TNIN_302641 [Trichonephila inaurata madagascariensis]|uniref:Uncharacterized protein n=1 Tax=Trichonephila inaurata madagascariensis TaxID=2747483 RepID=A0A8X6WU76_9ARAC|nr:hypothetical protein TNIN_302641 [Trichonephila inaurata madagascariensis]